MPEEKSEPLKLAANGDPILDQFGEEGFIDCTFRILSLVSTEREHRFHLAASFDNEAVGFDVVIVRERSRGKDGKPILTRLFHTASVPIIRYVKIKGNANPYDPLWEPYFECRLDLKMDRSPKRRKQLIRLWLRQDGLCLECGHKITRMTGLCSQKIIWRVYGGSDNMSNRVLLHPKCHTRVHNRELEVMQPRLPKEALQEA